MARNHEQPPFDRARFQRAVSEKLRFQRAVFGTVKAWQHHAGTVLLLTLMMLILLTFEVAVISLVAQRGFGDEAMLQTQNLAARRGGEVVLNRMEEDLYNHIRQNGTGNITTLFANGGAKDIDETDLMILNPGSGATEATGVRIAAWVEEQRGIWYHLVGRAKNGGVDLVAHRWIRINPCVANTGGTLSTILAAETRPGSWEGIAVDSTGRVFIGEEGGSGASSAWTWQDGVLSTVLNNVTDPIRNWGINVGPDNRFYLGSGGSPGDNGSLWTWKNGVLSTLVNNASSPGSQHAIAVAPDGRSYFSSLWWSANSNVIWTWKEGSGVGFGLSTILNNRNNPGLYGMSATDGGIAFAEYNNPGQVFYWKNGILSTVLPATVVNPHVYASTLDGRIYFGQDTGAASANFWTWKANVLSTLASGMNLAGGNEASFAGPDGRVYFGSQDCPGPYLTWQTGLGLSTILSSACWPGDYGSAKIYAPDNRLYLKGDPFVTWKNGVLSTITTSGSAGWRSIEFANDGRVFFGKGGTGRFWTWKSGVLSTILSTNETNPGTFSTGVTGDGRVYFGEEAAPGSFWTWKNGILSTLVDGETKPGYKATRVDPTTGAVYFAETEASPGSFWVWTPGPDCSNMGY